MNILIADAAPLILLGKAGLLSLLPALTEKILYPTAVYREIRKGNKDDAARQAVESGFGAVVRGIRIPKAVRECGTLDAGERAALALCLRTPESVLLCDDGKGRKAADRLKIPKIGTLGILVIAHQQGLLSELVPAFHAVRNAGIYADDALFARLAESVGEKWVPQS